MLTHLATDASYLNEDLGDRKGDANVAPMQEERILRLRNGASLSTELIRGLCLLELTAMEPEWRHGCVAGDPEATRNCAGEGLINAKQTVRMSRSVECSSKEKKRDRGLVVRVLRTSEVKVTGKQNKNQSKPPPPTTKTALRRSTLSTKTGKFVEEAASAALGLKQDDPLPQRLGMPGGR